MRRCSPKRIRNSLRTELKGHGDHEQSLRVCNQDFFNTQSEACVSMTATLTALALADCDSFGYNHDGKKIQKVEINTGIFEPVKDGVP